MCVWKGEVCGGRLRVGRCRLGGDGSGGGTGGGRGGVGVWAGEMGGRCLCGGQVLGEVGLRMGRWGE